MTCETTLEYLDDFALGNLANIPGDVQEHVTSCKACQKAVSGWSQIETMLDSWKIPAPPEDLVDNILTSIEIDNPFTLNQNKFIPGPWMVKLALAACLVFALTMGFYVSRAVRTSPEVLGLVQKPTAQPESQIQPVLATPTKSTYQVSVNIPLAKSVHIVGDFNQWQKQSTPLAKNEQGQWSVTLAIPRGYYQYQLWIDGKEFLLDPSNSRSVSDGFGGENSVILL